MIFVYVTLITRVFRLWKLDYPYNVRVKKKTLLGTLILFCCLYSICSIKALLRIHVFHRSLQVVSRVLHRILPIFVGF